MKFEKPFRGGSDQVRRSYGKSGETRNSGVVNPGIKLLDSPQATKPSSTREPVQRARQFRRSVRELTDEFMTKADELEKLFAEHQLHAPLNHSNSLGKERIAGSPPGCEVPYLADYNRSIRSVSFSIGLRGKFYERYMEKRDAKLREEWRTRRVEKEMKLRALQECFDRRSSELRAKLFRPPEGHESISKTRCRVDKLRSFNARSSVLWTQQGQQIDSIHAEEEEEAHVPLELKTHQNNRFPDQDLPSLATRSTAIPALQSLHSKASIFASTRRPTEYPISQSFPTASNLHQQKTKRLPAVSKTRTHSERVRPVSFAQSKINREELPPLTKEEKPGKQSQSMRRRSAPNSNTVIS
ncbi:uncharacterized protein LOC116201234 [Punica granatum]|uniref:Uncharacterized protein LOC116201234 n=1 Tax=Punica granatum TaxID=22663 RepID=A0A218W257_PUNGR|nr:uncharacterized protein LOC116201234 [Punica granatum]OWM66548.1 hypothetical protein CDL15_Pgr013765 [Punica granatum]